MCIRLELKMATRELRRQLPGVRLGRQDLPLAGTVGAEGLAPVIVDARTWRHDTACWGLVGSFLDHPPLHPLLTLPLEGLANRPFYSRLFREHRCLVPASGFIAGKNACGEEIRLHIASGKVMLLAAIYDQHPAVGASFAVITQVNAVAGAGKLRVPLVVDVADAAFWLNDEVVPDEEVLGLLQARMREFDWGVETLPLPEPSPQLAFRFACAGPSERESRA